MLRFSPAFLGSFLVLVAASVSQAARADAPACGMLTIHAGSTSVAMLANGLDFCLTVNPSPANPGQIAGIHISGPGANDNYSLAQLNAGVDLVPFVPGLLRLTGHRLLPALGGSVTMTYKGAGGTSVPVELMLSKHGTSWTVENDSHAVKNYADMRVDLEVNGDRSAPVITGIDFSLR